MNLGRLGPTLLVIGLFASTACSESGGGTESVVDVGNDAGDEGTKDAANNGGSDGGSNGGTDGGMDGGGVEPIPDDPPLDTPITVVLENATNASVWYMPYDCSGGTMGWVSLADSTGDLDLSQGCACECSSEPDCIVPPTCSTECTPPEPTELSAGGTVEFQWDGRYWADAVVEGTSCQRRLRAPETFEMTMCWGASASADSLESTECAAVAGTLMDAEIRHTITP